MHRPWAIPGALLVLVLLALLWWQGDSEEPVGPEAGSQHDPLSLDSSDSEQAGSPTLIAAGEERGTQATGVSPGGVESAAGMRPGEVLVLSHETLAPLEKAHARDEKGLSLAETDEEGVAQIGRVPAQGIALRITCDGYLPAVVRLRQEERVEATLQPGVPVRGKIVRAGGTSGSSKAEVFVWEQDLEVEIASFTTDEDGAFEISAVRPNRPFLMTIQLEGLVPQVKHIVVDAPTEGLEILVGEGGRLSGYATTADLTPVAGKEVHLVLAGEVLPERRPRDAEVSRTHIAHASAAIGRTQTDESGRYVFEGIELGRRVQPLLLAGGRRVVRGKAVQFKEVGETGTRDLKVGDAARLRLQIVDAAGEPIGDADVLIDGPEGQWAPATADSDGAGVYKFENLHSGTYTARATKPGAPDQMGKTTIGPGADGTIKLTFPNARVLRGRVSDKEGAPVWKAKVEWVADKTRVTVRTEQDGSFEFLRLPGPTGRLIVSTRDLPASHFAYETQLVEEVTAPGPPVEVTLKNGTRVIGRVEDLPEGTKVESVMFPGTRWDELTLLLGEERTFQRRGPPRQASAFFMFRTRGHPPLLIRDPRPFDSEEVRDLGPLFFKAVNPREGRVLDKRGQPLWAAKVTLRTPWSEADVRTDRQGDFLFAHMPREDLPIWIDAEGYPLTPVTLKTASEFQRQVFRLQERVNVEFQVWSQPGKSAGLGTLLLEGRSRGAGTGSNPTLTLKVGPKGRVRTLIAPGIYEASVRDARTSKRYGAGFVTITNAKAQTLPVLLHQSIDNK